MKVLFIGSGTKNGELSPVVKNQAISISIPGIEIHQISINGRGLMAYIKHIGIIKKYRKNDHFDIFHAHYSLSAFTATLAGCRPLVVSLLGSDIYEGKLINYLIRLCRKLFWAELIVKSESMKKKLGQENLIIQPNGVDLNLFKPGDSKLARKKTKFKEKNNILFLADPNRPVKNYLLAKQSIELLKDIPHYFHVVYNKSHSELVEYYNAADVILLSSHREGSPNVIKEAMACNCPIVSTDVGDVKWIMGDSEGCYISSFEPENMAEKIKLALDFGKRTKGRKRIIELGLDSESVAQNLIKTYSKILEL